MIRGIDISNYSGVPTVQQTECWWDQGIRFVIIGLQSASIARRQQAMCDRFSREYYVDLPGRDLTIPEPGARVWIDIEEGCYQRAQDVAVDSVLIRSKGFVPGIYGNGPSFAPVLGNDTSFSEMPLFYANYPRDGQPPDFDTFQPLNGWTRPTVWQYAGSVELCGVNVDLNVMEDALTEDEKRKLDDRDGRVQLDNLLANWFNISTDRQSNTLTIYDPVSGLVRAVINDVPEWVAT